MYTNIKEIEGIEQEYIDKLAYVGVRTVVEFLALTKTPEQRENLSRHTDIPLVEIDNWTSMIDLTRVDGIGFQYAELLTSSGVLSVDDLRVRNAEHLYESIKEANQAVSLEHIPSEHMLESFIANSKQVSSIIDRHRTILNASN